jgi:hypothetical protein
MSGIEDYVALSGLGLCGVGAPQGDALGYRISPFQGLSRSQFSSIRPLALRRATLRPRRVGRGKAPTFIPDLADE